MNFKLIVTILSGVLFCTNAFTATPDFSMVGFAKYDGAAGQVLNGGTTGGAGGKEVTVTTAEDLIKYISVEEPYIIYVSGPITLPPSTLSENDAMYEVKSNKSIIGVGSDPAILACGLNIGPMTVSDAVTTPPANATKNVIIQNIRFTGGADDLINVQMHSHHVWIDHCDFSNAKDGCIDIKRGSDWVTVSWNKFSNHKKTSLVGHSEGNEAQDLGHLHVTYHHNWFNATVMRHPRVRFGSVHVYNNYYNDINDYGIGVGIKSQVYSESNSFENLEDCAQYYEEPTAGWIIDIGSLQVNTEAFPTNPEGVTWKPSTFYTHTLDSASLVKEIVMQYAGVGKMGKVGITPYKKTIASTVNRTIEKSQVFSIHGKSMSSEKNTVSSQVMIHRNIDGKLATKISIR